MHKICPLDNRVTWFDTQQRWRPSDPVARRVFRRPYHALHACKGREVGHRQKHSLDFAAIHGTRESFDN